MDKKKIIVVIVVVLFVAFIISRVSTTTPFGIGFSQLTSPRIKNIVESLPHHPTKTYGKRSISGIKRIVWHHSTNTGKVENQALYHINKHGWPGIGYHFFIDVDGTIYQTNYLETLSYHVSGYNTTSIGVCLNGNFDFHEATQAQQNSAKWLAKKIRNYLGRNIPSTAHTDFASKSCPGYKMKDIVRNW